MTDRIWQLINDFFAQLPHRLRQRRLVTATVLVVMTAIAVAGIGRLSLDNSVDAFFAPEDPAKQAYDRFRATFGSDEVLYIVYRAKDGDVFSSDSMRALKGLHDELLAAKLERVTDIDSLINASYLEADGSTLVSRDFVGDNIPTSARASDRLAEEALRHPDYPRLFVSPDRLYGSILIRTDFNARPLAADTDSAATGEFSFAAPARDERDLSATRFEPATMKEYVPFIDAVRAITEKPAYAEHFTFHFTGNPELMAFIATVVMQEMGLILLGSFLLITLVLGFLFRSIAGVLWPGVVVILTILWTLGTIGWSGIPTADTVNIILFLLVAVGVADSVHILSGYLFHRRQGSEHELALQQVFAKSGLACMLTSLTTAVGLLAMTVVPIVSMQRFGVFAATGVCYAFVLTVVVLPLLLDIRAPRPNRARPQTRGERRNGLERWLERAIEVCFTRPKTVVVAFVLLSLLLVSGFRLIEVDSNTITIFDEDQPIRVASEVSDREMAGSGNLEIVVDTGVPDGQKKPAVLAAVDDLQAQLEKRFPDIVRKSISLANVTKDSHRVLHEGTAEAYRIPSDAAVLAETLVLFDGANPEDRRLLVTDDYRTSRITINTRNLGSSETVSFMTAVSRLADECFTQAKQELQGLTLSYTGQIPLFRKMMADMSWSQIKSFAVSLAIISLILLLVFGSLRTGLISIAPNLFPIVAVFGVMGYFNIPLDLHTLLVLPIVIGISVDDTIHFLTHFRIEYQRSGDAGDAIREALREAGQAMVLTSVVLAAGYLIFLLSVNKGFFYFGIVSSIAVLAAIAADLLLLPGLLWLAYGSSQQTAREPGVDSRSEGAVS